MVTPDPNPIAEIAAGATCLVLAIFVHGVGLRAIMRISSARLARCTPATPAWQLNLVLATVIVAIVALHLFETLAFALALNRAGIIGSMRDSYYLVLGSYTTIGSKAVALPHGWRLLAPMVAMAGLFTFSWTASLLVSVMGEITRLDRAQALRDARDEGG